MTAERLIAEPEREYVRGAFVHKLPAETFEAWRISPDSLRGECNPLAGAAKAATIDDAVQAAMVCCRHKEHFVVVATGRDGERTAHFYAVKQRSRADYRRQEDGTTARFQPLYADHLFDMAATAFAPKEPWRWSPGADVIGGRR